MARGRKAKPASIKIAEGNPGGRPLDDPTIDEFGSPLTDIPPPPDWLDDSAREFWDEYAPRLHKMGVLSDVDSMAFERVVSLASRIIRYEKEIAVKGETYETDQGLTKANPKVGMLEKAESALLRYMSEFGMTPAARNRVDLKGSDDKTSALAKVFSMEG